MKNTIVLGVTGSIAAYKAADLTSQLVKKGKDVVVIMTAAAQKLVCPQTFLTLSRNPVITDLWSMPDWQPGHIELADRAKLLVIVPCSANFIGKYANGIADDALTTYAISHTGKVMIVPAMNPKMWKHPAVQQNVKILKSRGVEFIGPVSGRVACGDDGEGRMEEVPAILSKILRY
ncbi:MAG TPA: phosphopantothenoylcysteine decarboxylase [Lentisphaeria bacterium]|nr:MAG: phosphopantothenoylcysteine decarboxylase [Lentisphaerae bacterium GWF2_49_21]HBC87493.1 phosphopantothenoylcysteine decarboxylase [Lentisphaeria bacterium]